MKRACPALFGLLLGLLSSGPGPCASTPAEQAPKTPLEVDLEEKIEVQLVLVDVTVIDSRGNTVSDLAIEDFRVKAGGRVIEITSLDANCPDGGAGDPRPARGETTFEPPPPAETPEFPELAKRFVLVFDYFHMNRISDTLDSAAEATKRSRGGEHMVVSLGGNGLRVEQPFTTDQEQIRATLERMRQDPALYAGAHGRLTERRFFDRIRTLFGLLETVPGRKLVVLYSGSFIPDGFTYDSVLKELAGLSVRARSSIYSVDSEGMRGIEMVDSGIGGPLMLRRLSNETGGRPTANTNDLSMGYARAQRDAACRYTLGFVDRSPDPNRFRRLSVKILRDGHRAIYPAHYVVRTKKRKRRALVQAAHSVPEMFESEALSTDVLLMRPRSPRRWEAVVAVSAQPDPGLAPAGDAWDMKGILRLPSGAPIHTFKRTVRPRENGSMLEATHFESIRPRPGRYLLSVVLSHPLVDRPLATTVEVEFPEIPRNDPFLVGPLLGRRVNDFTVAGVANPDRLDQRLTIEPLLGRQAIQGEPLASQTWLCWIGPDELIPEAVVGRVLTSDGRLVQAYDATPVDLTGNERVRCHTFLDELPLALSPGSYRMLALSEVGSRATVSRKATFEVLPAR